MAAVMRNAPGTICLGFLDSWVTHFCFMPHLRKVRFDDRFTIPY